ncbi:MAG: amylo-alpha-1,6-glucosidase [Acidobacteriota bacterium]|nr:amylo-alpha-1,6-glucosidase [Acidobacteriota bacterium]
MRLRPRDDTRHVSQGRTVLATDRRGFISEGAEHGLFAYQTRLLSRYRYLINGEPPGAAALSNVEQHSWLGYYITLAPGVDPGPPDEGSGLMEAATEQTLELRLSRHVGRGVHEDVDLTNYTLSPTAFELALEVEADFADQEEITRPRRQHGLITRLWRALGPGTWQLSFDYRAEHSYDRQGNRGTARLRRGVALRFERASSPPSFDRERGCVAFRVELGPRETWHACVNIIPLVEGEALEPQYRCGEFGGMHNELDRRREIFLSEATGFSTPGSGTLARGVVVALEQAKRDLAALRLHDLDRGPRAWTMAAGLPIYTALYGRDVLTAAWQASLASTDMMKGTLPLVASLQGRERNDWRDEQPGKMLHEAHAGPLSVLNFTPRRRYYGSITTSGFYPVAVSELWHWTGDKELIKPLVRPALRALSWLDRDGDRDGDGFYEYLSLSEQGTKHQGWKDSPDAVVDEDGRQVEPPIATCEEQGFAYLAKLHMSEVLWWLDEKDLAKRLYREAGELKKRFNEAFWMEDEGFFAMGLDSRKRQIKSIGSNAGHCLATAVVEESLVAPTAERLMREDLFTGWGVRTLSSENPAFDPYSYHRGSVWPVENGTFALAFLRYGLHAEVERVCRAMFEAAALFDFYRLPELFGGHPRDADHPFPALYPQGNSPQAWSASAVFCFLQSLVGLYPYAPLNLLLLDTHLPEWLPEMTLRNLRVGGAAVDIRFYRKEGGQSDYEVLDKRGTLHVLRQPSPWSLTASFAERLKDALMSLLPGR